MRRAFALFLTLLVLLSLCACKARPESPPTEPSEGSAATPPAAVEATHVYDDSLLLEIVSEDGSCDVDGQSFPYTYHVPQLIGGTSLIQAINREIDQRFGAIAREEIALLQEGAIFLHSRIEWQSCWNGSLLCLVLVSEDIDHFSEYQVFRYDFAEDRLLDNADLLERLGLGEEPLLRAARRAVMQDFDRTYRDCPDEDLYRDLYYQGSTETTSTLERRADTLAAVGLDTLQLYLDGGACMAIAPRREETPGGTDWNYYAVKLDLDRASGVSKTVSDEVVTAALENDRVTLTFADTEQAAYYLLGYHLSDYDYIDGRSYRLVGDDLPLGPQHKYEVQGLYSSYKDLFLGGLGREYLPYLFLVTEENTLELVNIAGCFQYGAFCAMPVPGVFPDSSLPGETVEDEYGQQTVFLTDDSGQRRDMSLWASAARGAGPRGVWSGVLEEIEAEGGSYSKMAVLSSSEAGALEVSITELDAETNRCDLWPCALGMTEDGVVCGCISPFSGDVSGAFAYSTRLALDGAGPAETLFLKTLTGDPLFGQKGEVMTFQRVEDSFGFRLENAFLGGWTDVNSGRCHLTISPAGPDVFAIEIFWGDSASTTYAWTMTGTPGLFDGAMRYEDCVYKRITSLGETETEEILSTGGSGSLVLAGSDRLLWQDDSCSQSADCVFVPADDAG